MTFKEASARYLEPASIWIMVLGIVALGALSSAPGSEAKTSAQPVPRAQPLSTPAWSTDPVTQPAR